ncbi:aspartate/glutamate racemase family protein [Shewanella xiamenensis]|uniref:aspartate/glutamate racemase family protein n=1 Tax=Shewanella xiamenensis TaxID=332186 RepID=UPI0021503518|nr:aspartate/glutamate racemase family protein [Shewanella xiamenensis]MCR4536501.1 aspartate/glutamate racemase family protein [Shewanella xiamenensis]WHF55499.1 aspartate/glutamate racemase family protein [Shewanella xiamenensis]
MKTIGMLGGMSWESTASYYKAINESVRHKLGGLHSAKICMYSVDFNEIERLQHQGKWAETAKILSKAASRIEAGGADFLLICTNTMHKVASEIESSVSIPILHIADATAKKLVSDGIKKVGLLGTRFTMEQDFYKQRIIDRFGVEVIVPNTDEQTVIHDIIYNELCLGIIKQNSRNQYLEIINGLYQQGAEAIILGCTEIALLVQQEHTDIPLYDTTAIHAEEAVLLSLGQ